MHKITCVLAMAAFATFGSAASAQASPTWVEHYRGLIQQVNGRYLPDTFIRISPLGQKLVSIIGPRAMATIATSASGPAAPVVGVTAFAMPFLYQWATQSEEKMK